MEYIKSAVQHIAAMSGVTAIGDGEEPPTSKLYNGKLSAKVVLEYIDVKETAEDAADKDRNTSKEQFMKIEVQGNEDGADLSSFIQQSGYTHLIIAVDQSGSMSGSPINQVKQALICLLDETANQGNLMVDIFTYYQKMSRVKCTRENYKEKINEITAKGRTYFNVVFDKIRAIATSEVRGREVKKTVVVFMTDGADTSGEHATLVKAQKECMAHLKTAPQATVVHVVGFSKEHDYKFMNEINHLGKQEGLFRYCEPSDGPEALRDKLAELFEHITAGGQEFFDVEVEVPGGLRLVTNDGFATKRQMPLRTVKSEKKISEEEAAATTGESVQQTVLQANTWLYVEKEETAPKIYIKVLQSVNGEKIPLNCEVVEISGRAVTKPVDKVEWSLNILERNIDLLTAKIGEAILRRKDLSALEARLVKLQRKVSETKVYDFRVKKDDRKMLLDHVAELQAKLDGVHKMIADVKRGECNQVSMLAKANDLRYQAQFTKTRRHRIMDQRTRINAEKMKTAQQELDNIGVNRQEIEALSTDSAEFYLCTLSQMNVQEVMLDPDDREDCLGFGLAVKRPEHVLDDPTAVRIWAVSGTLVSRSAMMDALHYKIDVEGHLMAHGGFDKDTELGVATVGVSREPINAWLPMYICDTHWQRVKILLKPTLGYFCTLDPLGYSYKQIDVLFQVLGSMIAKLEPANCNEHQLKMIFGFQRLCVAVIKDFELLDAVTETVEKFLADPSGRTKDIVPNLFVLFGYIVCLPNEKLQQLFGADTKERKVSLQSLWLVVLSESLRRAARAVFREPTDAQIDGMLQALIETGLCNSEQVQPPVNDADLLHIWRACGKENMTTIDTPDYNIDTGVQVPEITEPEPNSAKLDKAMEVWAQAKVGAIKNKNQQENVRKASLLTQQWVEDGHQSVDDAIKPGTSSTVTDVLQISKAGESQTSNGKAGSEKQEERLSWNKDSMKRFMSVLQVTRKLTGAMYPRIGQITGYMAYLNFWLKYQPDILDMDKNSGMPPKDWIENAKTAVNTMHGKISDKAKSLAAEKCGEMPLVQSVVIEQKSKLPDKPYQVYYDEDDGMDEEEETPQEQVQREVKEARRREHNVCEVLSVVHSGQAVPVLCAMLTQALKYNRNAAAREAAANGKMLDLKLVTNAQMTLENVRTGFKEKQQAAILSAVEKVFWQRSNYAMLQAPTVWSFIGYMMNTYKDRGEGIADFLKILTSKEKPVEIPLMAEKVKIILTGKHKEYVVLSNGNIWVPEKKVRKKFAEGLGLETWEAIEVDLLSNVEIHVYRESDIPNRHGHCNSNPYIPNALRKKLGMDLLPVKTNPAKKSKIKNKYTR